MLFEKSALLVNGNALPASNPFWLLCLIISTLCTGAVTTYAGTGTLGYVDGAKATATFNTLHGFDLDTAGTLYVADYDGNYVRKVSSGRLIQHFRLICVRFVTHFCFA